MFDNIENIRDLMYKQLQQKQEEILSDIEPTFGDMYASTQFNFLKEIIEDYEKKIPDDSNVAIWLTNFGQQFLMQVTQVAYKDPVLIVFKGFVNGKESTLIQHINQLNFLLTTTPKSPEEPKRKIGFN